MKNKAVRLSLLLLINLLIYIFICECFAQIHDIPNLNKTPGEKYKVYLKNLNIRSRYFKGEDALNYKSSKFVSTNGEKPMTYGEYKEKFEKGGNLNVKLLDQKSLKKLGIEWLPSYLSPPITTLPHPNIYYKKGKLAIIVNSDLYPKISSSIERYQNDIETQGYYAEIYTVGPTGTGTASELRQMLQSIVDLTGVLFIGRLPVAWFEDENSLNCMLNQTPPCHAEWICDLYFMDLNGDWSDQDNNGVFDSHTGDTKPEIFLGRLSASMLNFPPRTGKKTEADLINEYFAKNHEFRKGNNNLSLKGIAFIDDPWAVNFDSSMDLFLNEVTELTDPEFTNAENYKDILTKDAIWLHTLAHSSYIGHTFYKNWGSESTGSVTAGTMKEINNSILFYNLHCCYAANFLERNYIAGWYVFGKGYGLVAVGSTKSGGLGASRMFYGALSEGLTVGEALAGFFDSIYPLNELDISIFYGMTIIGDPLLNWRVGAVPIWLTPQDGSVFHESDVTLIWSPVNIDEGKAMYDIITESWNQQRTFWAANDRLSTDKSWVTVNWNTGQYRWRLKTKLFNKWGPWTEWQYVNRE